MYICTLIGKCGTGIEDQGWGHSWILEHLPSVCDAQPIKRVHTDEEDKEEERNEWQTAEGKRKLLSIPYICLYPKKLNRYLKSGYSFYFPLKYFFPMSAKKMCSYLRTQGKFFCLCFIRGQLLDHSFNLGWIPTALRYVTFTAKQKYQKDTASVLSKGSHLMEESCIKLTLTYGGQS